MNISSISVLFLMFLMGGCAVHQSGIDCPPGNGARCRSISEVNGMVDIGERVEMAPIAHLNTAFVNRKEEVEVRRIPEKTMRVWMNGFTDDKGDYIQSTYVYTVLEPGRWDA